jgi:ketosteroid isomerase-like protein
MQLLKAISPGRARFVTALLLVIAGITWAASSHAELIEDADHPAIVAAAQLGVAIAAGDVDTLKALIAPDVLIFESGGVESSLVEYEGHHMPADIAFMKNMSSEVISRRVIEAGDSAIVLTHSKISGIYKEKEVDLSSTETLVLRNMGGPWKIIHIHWSSR